MQCCYFKSNTFVCEKCGVMTHSVKSITSVLRLLVTLTLAEREVLSALSLFRLICLPTVVFRVPSFAVGCLFFVSEARSFLDVFSVALQR